jgi:hypothetical protein
MQFAASFLMYRTGPARRRADGGSEAADNVIAISTRRFHRPDFTDDCNSGISPTPATRIAASRPPASGDPGPPRPGGAGVRDSV